MNITKLKIKIRIIPFVSRKRYLYSAVCVIKETIELTQVYSVYTKLCNFVIHKNAVS